jgi:hypothetical protein
MNRSSRKISFDLLGEWHPGSRTDAWDRLWQQILLDVLEMGKPIESPMDVEEKPINDTKE